MLVVDGERGGSCGVEPDVEGGLGDISEVLLLAPGDLGDNSGGVTRSLSLDDRGVNLGGAGLDVGGSGDVIVLSSTSAYTSVPN